MKISTVNDSKNELPKYAHLGDSGVDLQADFYGEFNEKFLFNATFNNIGSNLPSVIIEPGGRALIPTNIKTAIPLGYEIQIRSRSGLALKNGIIVLNSPGTIDAK